MYTIASVTESFILARTANGRAKRTIADYHRVLDPFVVWCEERGTVQIDHLSRNDVQRHVADLRGLNWSEATVGIHVRNIRAFLNWCYKEQLTEHNLASALETPRQVIRNELPLSPGEISLLLQACHGDPRAARDKALILMFVDTGLRVGEMATIKRDDLHIDETDLRAWLQVYSKKNKQTRFVILGQRATAALLEYLNERDDKQKALWIGIGNKGLEAEGIYQAIKRRAKAAGLEDRVHPHLFRRTFTTIWLDNKGDSERLRVLQGWSTETVSLMLKIYTGSALAQLMEAHRQAGPVDNLPL